MRPEQLEPRTVESCPHRTAILREGSQEVATCRIVADSIGAIAGDWARVPRQACTACCETFAPSCETPNPVVASMIYSSSSQIAASGGTPGCSRVEALQIRQRVLRRLDVSLATDRRDEPDTPERCEIRAERGLPSGEGGESGVTSEQQVVQMETRAGTLEQLLPPPRRRSRRSVRTWSVGVTTAARIRPTLRQCLDSLGAAGWPTPHLFVDGSVPVPEPYRGLPMTFRDRAVGAWPNYHLGAIELLMRQPGADAYLIAQDDAVFYHDASLREYLEYALWPGHQRCIVSLYCSAGYTRPEPGWHSCAGRWGLGAVAFVWPREVLREFVADPQVFNRRWRPGGAGLVHIDDAIGRWAFLRGVEIWFPCPSLVQHVGEVSTLWPDAPATGKRRADWFAGGSC